tara:strand:+ start:25181 stop:25873 length:693 start_codon:yes stop_codon:yes gene_type:complete
MKIAIIPARAGSKRIPKKNIKFFFGKPMIYWSIRAAKKTKLFDKIIVSTDNKKIAKIAKKYKAEVPFLRPAKISGDKTPVSKAVTHTLMWLKNKGFKPQDVCCIFATAAFIRSSDIKKGFTKLKKNKWNYVFSATNFPYPIFRSFQKKKRGELKMVFKKNYFGKNTQYFSDTYHDAGQFYWGKASTWLKSKPIFSKSSTIINIPRWRAHDIDTLEDWEIALKIGKAINKF